MEPNNFRSLSETARRVLTREGTCSPTKEQLQSQLRNLTEAVNNLYEAIPVDQPIWGVPQFLPTDTYPGGGQVPPGYEYDPVRKQSVPIDNYDPEMELDNTLQQLIDDLEERIAACEADPACSEEEELKLKEMLLKLLERYKEWRESRD
jgi:hypothetical protein